MSHPPSRTEQTDVAAIDWYAVLGKRVKTYLPGYMGFEVDDIQPGTMALKVTLRPHHLAPNGYLHAGTVLTLADTTCGFGCLANLPAGATNFTTLELKSNFLRTATEGTIRAVGTLVHGGRTTQVWDATVFDPQQRPMALFRCTQMILYSKE